jgi:hypothetical protein
MEPYQQYNRTSKNKHNNCEINPNDFNNFFSKVAENPVEAEI